MNFLFSYLIFKFFIVNFFIQTMYSFIFLIKIDLYLGKNYIIYQNFEFNNFDNNSKINLDYNNYITKGYIIGLYLDYIHYNIINCYIDFDL